MASDPWASRDGQWDRISTLFEMVLSLPSEERTAFIDVSCGADHELRGEIESLVAAHDGAPAFLDGFHADVVYPALANGATIADADGARGDAPAPSVAPGDRIRHFVVHERLGSGGAGVVYRGRDTLLARDVAIKFLAPSLSRDAAARARLVREAQAASRLDDPHVCPIYAVESTVEGGLCIVMAYCAGGTLRERLRRGQIPAADLTTVAQHLARGLASAHHAGIVHGDIKPANVGFGEGDVARLLDFGVAVHAHDVAGGTRGLSGTLPYLAPELWRGETRGPRTDVWALGVTFFEMVTGHRPFAGADPAALREAILLGELPALVRPDGSSVAPSLAGLIRRMLSTEPEQRPADGAAVLAALVPVAAPFPEHGVTAVSVPSSDAPRDTAHEEVTRHGARNRRIAVSVVGAAALAVAGGAALSSTSPDAVSPPAIEVARTSLPLSSIAVLPFTTRGSRNIEYLADGMVDLLTPAFDGTGLVRGIDPNTVLGAAGERRSTPLDSAESRALAVKIRADRYVVGSIVATGATLTFRATLRSIDGREIGRAQTTVADSGALVPGIDALVRQLIATELLAPGDTIAGIAAATTISTRALRDYLDGERELRDARPAAAVAKFSDAVAADSMFALAWYRLARAARWNDVDSLSAHAAQKASQLAASLPPRQQSLIRAYYTLRFGSAVQAQRQFAQIVTDYPSDVEAWMLLGEAQFGSNPYYGRPIEESGTAFQRVMALDPRNREVTVYLMDLAANADRMGQLDTLYSMYFSPNSAGEQPGIRATYTALHRRRVAVAGAKRTVATLIDEPGLARVALQRISSHVTDRAAARAYAGVLVAAPTTRADGQLALATLDVADGRWDAAQEHFRSATLLDPDQAAEQRAYAALSPSVVVSADTLRALRRTLQTKRAVSVPLGGAMGSALSAVERNDLRQYLVGVLSVRLGDAAGVTAAVQALTRRPAIDSSRLAIAFSQAVTGHWQLRLGKLAAALAAFDGSIPDLPARLRLQHPALGQHLDRLARAEALVRLGRREEARRWYASVREGYGVVGAPFVASADSGVRATSIR
jgi:serine/threonine protein kinase/tetratricopeptide (TPR) repeat protein